jgi:hypothetical protein
LTVERNYFAAAFEAGEYDGRTLDEECYADLLEKVGGTSCDPEEAFEDDSECSICKLYYGPLEEGDDCDQSWVWDECGKGLACIEGECTDPCPELGEGESCVTEGGLVLGCESGLECDYNTETCTKPAGIGDSCEKVSCGEGLCDYDTFTCTAGAGEGESCGAGCAEGLWCDYGADGTGPMICRAAAEPGDSCANGEVCSTWCDGEVCVDPPEASCYE